MRIYHLFVVLGPYGEIPLDELKADEVELNVPNGPILVNAEDIKLVIPMKEKRTRNASHIIVLMSNGDMKCLQSYHYENRYAYIYIYIYTCINR
jgi:hypothetical protein